MERLDIDAAEQKSVQDLLDEVEQDLLRLETDEALSRAGVAAHELPVRIRLYLNAFRLGQLSGVLRLCGYQVDQERLGRTPSHWRERTVPSPAHREELMLVLCGSLLGDPFSWATQQDGRLIHDVLPILGHENEQLGSSSESLLTWHTEDAFHPLRGDFLGFACLRNPNAAATTMGYIQDVDLPDEVVEVLRQERFMIQPDEAHTAKNNSDPGEEFVAIEDRQRNPDRVAVLFGDPERPFVRADPYFMTVADGDEEAANALGMFEMRMEDVMFDVEFVSGEFCFIDNYRVVHGRKPFKARHDGTDRWLKRINVTRDLAKSVVERRGGGIRAIR